MGRLWGSLNLTNDPFFLLFICVFDAVLYWAATYRDYMVSLMGANYVVHSLRSSYLNEGYDTVYEDNVVEISQFWSH